MATERTRGREAGFELLLRPADEHALAGGESVGLDHAGRRRIGERAAVGTPAASSTSLAKLFDPSMRAAAALGPKTGMPP